ncbi:uncharacterized protein LOC133530499 [Cydia pomonella]|uniref:uncharacterized protein LOC133530499 n=1 Tax=Cydia pomonella TaxID=82600 RepID=UPI002ADD3506|nr:uncharacterized protein LOC133530499 [Cydia pomonella]
MNILRIVIFLVSFSFVYNDTNDDSDITEDKRVLALMKERKRYQRVRCSRRYTPGSCMDPVRPVWTFVVPLQSCTERLGCPSGLFANRFNSFEECTSMCRELVYLYMYLQSLDNETFGVPDEGLETSTRRASDIMYAELEQDKEDDQDAQDEVVDDVEADNFRRNFKSILSNLPESDPEYPDRQYEASDDRPPPQSHRELMEDTMEDLVVPDIDHFV